MRKRKSIIDQEEPERWDSARVTSKEENTLPSIPLLYFKIFIRIACGIFLAILVLALGFINICSLFSLISGIGVDFMHFNAEYLNRSTEDTFIQLNYFESSQVLRTTLDSSAACGERISFEKSESGRLFKYLLVNKVLINNLRKLATTITTMQFETEHPCILDKMTEEKKSVHQSLFLQGSFTLLIALCLQEIRGIIVGLYFVIFKSKDVKNSTKLENLTQIVAEIWNASATAVLVFFVLPNLILYKLGYIFLHSVGILLLASCITKWRKKGMKMSCWLDIIGLVFVLGGISLFLLEYLLDNNFKFAINKDYSKILSIVAVLTVNLNLIRNYSQLKPLRKDEGLAWVHLLAPFFRVGANVGVFYLFIFASFDSSAILKNQFENMIEFTSAGLGSLLSTDSAYVNWVTTCGVTAVFTSFLLSYIVVSVIRTKLQLYAFVIPGCLLLLGMPMFLQFGVPAIYTDPSEILVNFSTRKDGWFEYFHLGQYGCGCIAFIICVRHIFFDKSYPYGLERMLFDSPLYRPVWTLQSLFLHRRRHDISSFNFGDIEDDGLKKTESETVPMIFICTTLWHEEENEMRTLLTSILNLIEYVHDRENDKEIPKNEKFNLEVNIFFDNVFESHNSKKNPRLVRPSWLPSSIDEWQTLNKWVYSFGKILAELLQNHNGCEEVIQKGKTVITPYGGRLEYDILGIKFHVHLKNADRVQRGKRWSMVMYLYYLIGYKIDQCKMRVGPNDDQVTKDNSFILALDGDVHFRPEAVELVLQRMKRNRTVGACCNQIHPQGRGVLVWYQRFEYAVGHWLQKATEHVLGCVLCSPGCFSMMRMSFLSADNVMALYKSIATNPMEKLMYDQGEDRWLCTLILLAGGRIEFESAAHCLTYAPEDFETYYKQRRRWGPSTTANIWELIKNKDQAVKNNAYISRGYIAYQFFLLIFSVVGLSTTVMMVAEAFNMAVGDSLSTVWSYTLIVGPIVLYAILCRFYKNSDVQLSLAKVFSLIYSFIMALVLIFIIKIGVDCWINPTFLFFIGMAILHMVVGILHFDPITLLCGVIYYLLIPTCFIFLQIYMIANLNDVSWGTRSGPKQTAAKNPQESAMGLFQRAKKVLCGIEPEEVRKENEEPKKPDEPISQPYRPVIVETKETLESFTNLRIQGAVLYGGVSIRNFRRQIGNRKKSDWDSNDWNYFAQNLSKVTNEDQLECEIIGDSRVNISRRELNLMKEYTLKYFDWTLDRKAPLHRESKIFTLSKSEHDFWMKMIDSRTGYIRNQTKAEDAETQARIAEENAAALTELRDKLYFFFLFINLLWFIISVGVKQADLKISIPEQYIPGGTCGKDAEEGADKNDQIEPLSLFFLLFYVVVMTIQFLTMLWHRVSTFQHYLAYLRVRDLWNEIKKTKQKRSEKSSRPPPEKFSTVFNQDSFVSHKERRYIKHLWHKAIKAANNKTERRRSTQLETLVGFIRSSKAQKMPSPVLEESTESPETRTSTPVFDGRPRTAVLKEPEVIPDLMESSEENSPSSSESENEIDEVSMSNIQIPRPEVIRTSDDDSSSIGSLGRHIGTLRRMSVTHHIRDTVDAVRRKFTFKKSNSNKYFT